jgi:hypothetical protein
VPCIVATACSEDLCDTAPPSPTAAVESAEIPFAEQAAGAGEQVEEGSSAAENTEQPSSHSGSHDNQPHQACDDVSQQQMPPKQTPAPPKQQPATR